VSEEEIIVALTPPRPESIQDLEEIVNKYNVRTIIFELPEPSLIDKFLRGEVTVDDVLLDLELEYPIFTRELLLLAKRLHDKGIKVLFIDPYQEIATRIKVKLFLRKGLEELDKDLTARYIAMLELNLGKIFQEYYKAYSRRDFDKLLEATLRYAKFDAERTRFRTELRIRKLQEIVENLDKPILIHTHFINKLLPRELERRLGKPIKVVDLYEEQLKKIGKRIEHPGRRLTQAYLLHDETNIEKLKILAAKTIILVSQYPPAELIPTPENRYPMLKKDIEILEQLEGKENLEELKILYKKLIERTATHR